MTLFISKVRRRRARFIAACSRDNLALFTHFPIVTQFYHDSHLLYANLSILLLSRKTRNGLIKFPIANHAIVYWTRIIVRIVVENWINLVSANLRRLLCCVWRVIDLLRYHRHLKHHFLQPAFTQMILDLTKVLFFWIWARRAICTQKSELRLRASGNCCRATVIWK